MRRYARRTWGWYFTLLDRKHFKVKLLRFYAGKQCSNQYHNYRNELWLFLSGHGIFNSILIKANEWKLVESQNQHLYYALRPTLVLEIQYGEKCEESDIVRIR